MVMKLATLFGSAATAQEPGRGRHQRRGPLERAAGALGMGSRRRGVPAELTRLALSHSSGRIVAVSSRAGGVGKTALAAALGLVYDEAIWDSGGRAAVVDQDIGNPDLRGLITLASVAPTVFEIMARIEAGREWLTSAPAGNCWPPLAFYPERRDLADAYSPGQIERFAGQLRELYAITVVDLPNHLPAFTSSEAAMCAGWICVADLLLIPTTEDPIRLRSVLDYLDAPLVRGGGPVPREPMKVVVPCLRSPLRAVRRHPEVRGLRDEIRRRGVAIVDIPQTPRATLATVQRQPATEVDHRLRAAYIELALTVARALDVARDSPEYVCYRSVN
jgi:MinD-like ATPase involved in chromosome partitioning or flagellar assembly